MRLADKTASRPHLSLLAAWGLGRRGKSIAKAILVCATSLAVFASSDCRAVEPFLSLIPSIKAAKDLVVPIGSSAAEPNIRMRCGTLRMDRKSFGFLKIGLVPQLIAEDSHLEIIHSPEPSQWASALHDFIKANPAFADVEFRRISIYLKQAETPSVTAITGRIMRSPLRLQLQGVKVLGVESGGLHCAEAFVPLDGQQSGSLILTKEDNRIIRITDASVSPQP